MFWRTGWSCSRLLLAMRHAAAGACAARGLQLGFARYASQGFEPQVGRMVEEGMAETRAIRSGIEQLAATPFSGAHL
eukprot:4482044-Pyramimonas_sp.AAC.1